MTASSASLTLTREHYALLTALEDLRKSHDQDRFMVDPITATWSALMGYKHPKTRAQHEARIPDCQTLLDELVAVGYADRMRLHFHTPDASYYYAITDVGINELQRAKMEMLPLRYYYPRVQVQQTKLTREQVDALTQEMQEAAQQAVEQLLAHKEFELHNV